MKQAFRLGLLWSLLGLASGLLAGACGGSTFTSEPALGGESHFLHACTGSCGDGLECISGLCTRSCLVGASRCEALATRATCTAASIEPGAVAVCDVACSGNADCAALGNGYRCEGAFCRAGELPSAGDSAQDQAGLAANWSCLTTPLEPLMQPPDSPPTVSYLATVLDYSTLRPLRPPNLQVSGCLITDSDCISPIPSPVTALDDQTVRVDLPRGFDGYLRLTAPGYTSTEYYFLGPMLGAPGGSNTVAGRPIRMWPVETYRLLHQYLGTALDPESGMLLLTAADCAGNVAEGVRLATLNATNGLAWTSINGLPTSGAPTPLTDASGQGGFVNLRPGNYAVEASVPCSTARGLTSAPGGNQPCLESDVPYARTALRVRANVVSAGELRADYSYGR